MKKTLLLLSCASLSLAGTSQAATMDLEYLGKRLNGWNKKNIAVYTMDHVVYRTFKPVLSHSPDGSLFVSMRMDALPSGRSKGVCYLHVNISRAGYITSLQAKIRLKGKTYDSGLVARPALQPRPGEGETPAQDLTPWSKPLDQMSSELFSRLDAKILEADKDKKGEGRDIWARLGDDQAARVNMSTVIRHNLNLLSSSVRK